MEKLNVGAEAAGDSRLLNESLISLAEAGRTFPGRKSDQIAPSTVQRWCEKGTRTADGRVVRLESIRAGTRRFTSREAIARYVAALSEAPPPAAPTRTPSQRAKAQRRADEELKKLLA